MRRSAVFAAGIVAFAAATGTVPASLPDAAGAAPSQPLVVLFTTGLPENEAVDLVRAAGAQPDGYLGVVLGAERVLVPPAARPAIEQRLRANPSVQSVEVDQVEEVPEPRSSFERPPQFTASSVVRGAQRAVRSTRRVRCSRTAVLDTGVDGRHPALRGRVVAVFDALHQGVTGDPHGHGTHVAGIIAAAARRGVRRDARGLCALGVQLVSVRVLNREGQGNTSATADGIVHAVNLGAQVINLSLGGSPVRTLVEERAVHYAASRNVILIAASGNAGRNIDNAPSYPASYALTEPNVVAVASTNLSGRRLATFSNWGAGKVLVAGQGSNILSTWPNNGYRFASGTSMSAPEVSAVAARLKRKYRWGPARIRQRIADTVRRGPGFRGRVASGGALDFNRATR